MRYLKVLIIVLVIVTAILFGIHNPASYKLSFLSYQLMFNIPLWGLLMLFFFLGMLPIFFAGLPEKTAFIKNMSKLNQRKKELEKAIKSL